MTLISIGEHITNLRTALARAAATPTQALPDRIESAVTLGRAERFIGSQLPLHSQPNITRTPAPQLALARRLDDCARRLLNLGRTPLPDIDHVVADADAFLGAAATQLAPTTLAQRIRV